MNEDKKQTFPTEAVELTKSIIKMYYSGIKVEEDLLLLLVTHKMKEYCLLQKAKENEVLKLRIKELENARKPA